MNIRGEFIQNYLIVALAVCFFSISILFLFKLPNAYAQKTDVSLIWEADTYVPAQYKGKPLATPESTIRIIALPHFETQSGTVLDPSTLTYTWRLNGGIVTSAKGVGASSFTIISDVLRSKNEVSVIVESPGGSFIQREDITIPVVKPEAYLYVKSPLYGTLFNTTVQENSEPLDSTKNLVVYPYYFSEDTGSLSVSWKISDENTAGITSANNEISLARIAQRNLPFYEFLIDIKNTDTIKQTLTLFTRLSLLP